MVLFTFGFLTPVLKAAPKSTFKESLMVYRNGLVFLFAAAFFQNAFAGKDSSVKPKLVELAAPLDHVRPYRPPL